MFSGSINLVDTTHNNPLNFSGSGTIDWNQTTLNTQTHYDGIMSYTLDPTKLGLYNDKIEADLDFTLPAEQEVTHTGHASDAVFQFFGSVDSLGTIHLEPAEPVHHRLYHR